MKKLLAICSLALACLQVAAADDSGPVQNSIVVLCSQEGAAQGYKGKDLEDFVAKCMKARQSDGEIDPAILAAMSSC